MAAVRAALNERKTVEVDRGQGQLRLWAWRAGPITGEGAAAGRVHAALPEEPATSRSWDRSPSPLPGNAKALAAHLSAPAFDGWKMPARTRSAYSATLPITGASALSPMMASHHHMPCRRNGMVHGNRSAWAVTSRLSRESFRCCNHGANMPCGRLESLEQFRAKWRHLATRKLRKNKG